MSSLKPGQAQGGEQTDEQHHQQPTAPKPAGKGLFQCSMCQRLFARVDHLARHVRSHLQERPFECEHCSKSFGRPDLLKRHAVCHEGQEDGSKRQRLQNQAPRVSRACRPCAAAKLKCGEEKPCKRCQQRNLDCQEAFRYGKKGENATSESGTSDSAMSLSEVAQASPKGAIQQLVPIDPALVAEPFIKHSTPSTIAPEISAAYDSHFPDLTAFNYGDHEMSGFLRDVMTPGLLLGQRPLNPPSWEDCGSGNGPRGLLDFTIDSMAEFDASDFGTFEQLCNDGPGSNMTQMHITTPAPTTTTINEKRYAALRPRGPLDSEAYKRSSLGPWIPGQSDHGAAEVENLAALSNEPDSPETLFAAQDVQFHGGSLQRSTRDEFLAMILRNCTPERTHFVLRAFPTPELLQDLLQLFFSQHRLQPDSWFHLPTFRLNEQKPQLLAVLVAFGAVLTDIKSLHKLGFALQEAVRTTLPSVFEEANTNTRMLWALQAMMCEIEIGLWSGIKRKMEISESHTQIVYTMLRRAGRFQWTDGMGQKPPRPSPEDSGEALERKWRSWVEEESWIRVAFHAFITDAQTSMAMLTSPVISFSELSIPLPASQDLWLAETAEQWKTAYLRKTRSTYLKPNPSLIDHLRQPREISDTCDTAFSQLIILHGIWGMVCQHLQLQSALKGPGHSSSAAVALRPQELLQSLHHFEINTAEASGSLCPEASLVLELIQMRLHVPIEDIELFAGKGSIDSARRVVPSLQQWADSLESRQAVWHAGKTIRAAKMFGTKQLRGFFTIAVLHASLVMWTYSILAVANRTRWDPDDQQQADTSDIRVCLDGPETPAVRRFITLGKGVPCLTRASGPSTPAGVLVPLSDQDMAMSVVLDLLGAGFPSHPHPGESPPPLVENLKQLLRDLGKAATSVDGVH